MTFVSFKNKGEQEHGELSFLTNLPEGSLDRLESLADGYDSSTLFDPRFTVLLPKCLVGDRYSDLRQGCLFENIIDLKEILKHCLFFPLLKSVRFYRITQRGSCRSRFSLSPRKGLLHRLLSSLCRTLAIHMLPGTELTTTSHDAAERCSR